MDYRFVSENGEELALAEALEEEGHGCSIFINRQGSRTNCQGRIEHSGEMPSRQTILVFGSKIFSETAERYRAGGFRVYGHTKRGNDIAFDREASQTSFTALGINTVLHYPFVELVTALDFVEKTQKPMVVRFAGSTIFCKSISDTKRTLHHVHYLWKFSEIKDPFLVVLQRCVHGIDVSFGCFVDRGEMIEGTGHFAIKEKFTYPGGMGARVNSMASLVQIVPDAPWMKAIGTFVPDYTGPVYINGVVTRVKQFFGLSWKFGIDPHVMYGLRELTVGEEISPWFESKVPSTKEGIASILQITIPPYPFGRSVRGALIDKAPDAYMENAAFDAHTIGWHTSGVGGLVATVTSFGDPQEATRGALKKAEKFEVHTKQFRHDGFRLPLASLEDVRSFSLKAYDTEASVLD